MNVELLPLMTEAERWLDQGDLDRAATLFAVARHLFGARSALPHVGLARVALLRGDDAAAARLVAAAEAVDPTSGPAALVGAVLVARRGSSADALVALQRAVTLAPDAWLTHLNLGRALMAAARWPEAVKVLDRARALGPLEGAVLKALAAAQHGAGAHGVALLLAAEALAREPDDEAFSVWLVERLVEAEREAAALALARAQGLRLPRSAALASWEARLALRAADVDAARRATRRRLEAAPDDGEGWMLLGVLALGQLDLSEAWRAAEAADRLLPTTWQPLMLRAQVLEVHGLVEAAAVTYAEAARRAPAAWQPRVNAAVLALERGTPEGLTQAARWLEEARRGAPPEAMRAVETNERLLAARRGDEGARRALRAQA